MGIGGCADLVRDRGRLGSLPQPSEARAVRYQMAQVKVLAPAALILTLVCLTVAQERIVPRLPNISRIAKCWISTNNAACNWKQSAEKPVLAITKQHVKQRSNNSKL